MSDRTNGHSDIGRVIGPYTLIDHIGEGGMGDVFLAEQKVPIRRQVALKIVKLGMDTRDFVTRFESERQALALMDHPYIAQVYDAGATDRGRPYFVMEYVKGVPLLEYCDQNRLGVGDRLKLFVKICEGIQHAHQKAIIHRDLKSSNVLVVEEEGEPWPKIIDFGVAKAMGEKLTEQTLQTQMGQILGTPEFMSPEQADLTGGSIDTRTDVYLLGEMLYELLSGMHPFDREEMRKSGIDGMMYKIRMVDPPRPSARLKEAGPEADEHAAVRGHSRSKLVNRLAGDLDWIVMMAMEKSPALRYQTAQSLVEDLLKHRDSMPILARPPSTAYRWKKFVNRHRTGVIAAGFLLVAILLGITGTTIGMIRSQRAEKRANIEAATAKEVSDFMVGLFEVSDPGEARGSAITAREILDQGVRRIDTELAGQPMTQARLMNTMGRVYRELGLYGESKELLAHSLAKMEELDAGNDPQTATILDDFGHLNRETGEFGTAETYLEMALNIRERNFGPDHDLVAQSLNSLANLLYAKGAYEEALATYEKALANREKNLGPDHPDVATILKNIGAVHMVLGNHAQAEEALTRSLAIRMASLPANHPDISNSLTALGVFHYQQSQLKPALEYFERSLAIREIVYGPNHPQVAENLQRMAQINSLQGDFEKADELYARTLRINVGALGPDNPRVGETLIALGYHLFETARFAQAETTLTKGLDFVSQSSGTDRVSLVEGMETLGLVKIQTYDFPGALDLFNQILVIQDDRFGQDYAPLSNTHTNLGLAYTNLGDYPKAREHLNLALEIGERASGPESNFVGSALLQLGTIDTYEGDFPKANERLLRADKVMAGVYGRESRQSAQVRSQLGLLEYYQGHHEDARTYFGEAVQVQTKLLPPDHRELVDNHYNLACLNNVLGDQGTALAHLKIAVENGFFNPGILEDPDMASLIGNPEFDRLAAIARGSN